jgi:ABC-type glycerol-3-phosphate transport system substrate-binding protein
MITQGKQERRITSRDFLRLAGLGVGSVALAACAPKLTEAPAVQPTAAVMQPTTITWQSWGGADRFTPLIDAWAKTYPETAKWLTVQAVSGGQQDTEMYQQLRTALAAGGEGLPDFFEANADVVPEFATRGLMVDLTDKMQPFVGDLLPGALQLVSFKDKLVAVPTQVKSKVWYYRKDLFDAAGIDPAKIQSFDDLIEAGNIYHAKHPDSYIINIGPQPIHYWYGEILTTWDDIRFADENGKWFVTEHPGFESLLDWTKKVYDSGIAFKTDDWSSDWQPAISDGRIGSFLIGSWMTSFIPQFAPAQKGQWGLALWPEFSREGSEAGGAVVGISKFSKNVDAAFEFCSEFWLKPEGNIAWWEATGLAPMTKSGQSALKELIPNLQKPAEMSDSDWELAPVNYYGASFMDSIFESMDHVRIFPYDMSYAAELTILRQHTEAYLAGTESLQDALAGAQADMESQIGNPYKI